VRPSIKVEIASRKAEGNFFRRDVSKTVYENMLDAVEWAVEEGVKDLRPRYPDGFTRANVEGFTYKRTRLITGAPVQSRFGKVRLKPGLSRSPAGPKYPAPRRPYIVQWVWETGRYGEHRRTAHWAVKKTAAKMRAFIRNIHADLTKGVT